MSDIRVQSLFTYPIKSTRGHSVETMQLGRLGPCMDRRWMVVDSEGRFISQREVAAMCMITTEVFDDALIISAPGQADIKVDTPQQSESTLVSIWDDSVRALDCGDSAGKWFSEYLALTVRLVYMPDYGVRAVDSSFSRGGEQLAFADGFPLLLISQDSITDLNNRLESPVSALNFRPNIVVSGCTAHAEDDWSSITIGGLELSIVKPCTRCVIPSIDPQSGEKDNNILKALASYRRFERQIIFGQNVVYAKGGSIKCGDRVTVVS